MQQKIKKFSLLLFLLIPLSISCDKDPSNDERLIEYFITNNFTVALVFETTFNDTMSVSPMMQHTIELFKEHENAKIFAIDAKNYPTLWKKYHFEENLAYLIFEKKQILFKGFDISDIEEVKNYYRIDHKSTNQ